MSKYIVFASILFVANLSLADQVWSYKLESNRIVKSGKLKVIFISPESSSSRDIVPVRFKYKLETPVGKKESWIPYNLPLSVFDSRYFANLALGKEFRLPDVPHGWESRPVHFFAQRATENVLMLSSEDTRIKMFLQSADPRAPWKRVEIQFKLGSTVILLQGNLSEVSEE